MTVTAKEIKPALRGKSDFFSWQLYRWANKRPYALTIWEGTWNSIHGVDTGGRVLYIGFKRDGSWIHARQLRNLCLHGANLECFAYGAVHDTANWRDVSGQFWERYLEIGVCAIHGDYSHNWDVSGDKRTCTHCAKEEMRTKEVRMVERDVWCAA